MSAAPAYLKVLQLRPPREIKNLSSKSCEWKKSQKNNKDVGATDPTGNIDYAGLNWLSRKSFVSLFNIWHNEYGTWRVSDHILSDAAQEDPLDPAPAVGSHDDEVDPFVLGLLNNELMGCAPHMNDSLAGDIGLIDLFLGLVKMLPDFSTFSQQAPGRPPFVPGRDRRR